MIRKTIRLFNSLIINNIKFIFIKILHFSSFKFNFINIISPNNTFDIQNKGKLLLGKNCMMMQRNYLGVRENGLLEIKDGAFINSNCYIIAHNKIIIGKNVCIGPNVIIMDHDHKFGKNGVDKKKFKSKEIIIEDGAWIGANSVILRGSKIGSNCVIGAGSIVKGEIPGNSVFIQKRNNIINEIED